MCNTGAPSKPNFRTCSWTNDVQRISSMSWMNNVMEPGGPREQKWSYTLPENRPSQKETSIPTYSKSYHPFSGAMLVSGRVGDEMLPCIKVPIFPLFFWWGYQTMQISGNFEGIPLYKCIVWVGDIMTPVRLTVRPYKMMLGK